MDQVIATTRDHPPAGLGLAAGGCVLLHCELHDAGTLMDRDAEGVQTQWTAFCHKAERLVSRHAGRVRRYYLASWVADFDDTHNALRVAWGLHAAVRSFQRRGEDLWRLRIGLHASPATWNALGAHDPDLLRVAELASLADAGDTVVSTTVRDRFVDGLDATVEDLGECLLKHVQVSERAFRAQVVPAPRAGQGPVPVDDRRPGVTVIPFQQHQPDEQYAAVGDLLADRVIEQLSLSRHVRAIARLTGAAFRGRDQDTRLIRQHVPARYTLTGRYRVVGSSLQGKLRLSACLTDTETGECVWAEPDLQGSVGDLLARQSELVHTIATGAHHAMLETEVKVVQQQALTSLDHYALMLGGITRGLMVGCTVAFAMWLCVHLEVHSLPHLLAFSIAATMMLALFGVITGIFGNTPDQVAAITNFFVTPLSFLSGTFYSVTDLPVFFQHISHANPFFYMIDGFRYGFFGQSDVNPWTSVAIVATFLVLLALFAIRLLRSGYRLRH